MKQLPYILTVFCLIVFTSCDSFENQFYNHIEQGQINAIKNGADTFTLYTITDFEWDSVILIRGNESVPVFKEEIEEIINNRESNVHWEDRRFNGKVDKNLIYKTDDLPTFKDRFYFYTPSKKVVEKEIKSGRYNHEPYFELEYCITGSGNNKKWLTKHECKFVIKSNSRTVGNGTVFLFPQCRTRFMPDNIKFHDN